MSLFGRVRISTQASTAVLVMAGLLGATAFACNSLTGLDQNFTETDCTADCGVSPGTETGPPSPIDGAAGADGNPGTCTPLRLGLDAGKDLDANAADAGATDAGSDASANPDALVCPPPASGTCAPGNVSGFAPTWKPPTGAKQGKCTASQVATYYSQCAANGATPTACTAWRSNSSNATCGGCIESKETASSWGPLVFLDNGVEQINAGGCVALLEPCNAPCAEAYEAAATCDLAACESNCPVGTDPASFAAYKACVATADSCGCSKWTPFAACTDSLKGPLHPASICVDAPDFQTYFMQVVPVFCGN